MILPHSLRYLLLLFSLLGTSADAAPQAWTWLEAESPAATNFPAAKPEVDDGKEVLSGGTWISATPIRTIKETGSSPIEVRGLPEPRTRSNCNPTSSTTS